MALSIFKDTYIWIKPAAKLSALLFIMLLFSGCANQGDPITESRKHHSQADFYEDETDSGISDEDKISIQNSVSQRFEIPELKSGEQIIKHFAFTLSYNEDYEQPNWVAYVLKAEYLLGKEKRLNDFRPDPAVTTFSAEPEDYRNSGFDRGHLVPAGDMKWSKKAMSESFLMSNICPQDHNFNAGIWENLEADIRKWVKRDSELYIITGPVFEGEIKTIGKNKVRVPSHFYKAVLDVKGAEKKAIAFIIPNQNLKTPYYNYAVSVDSLEKVIDLNLFYALPDDFESEIEKTHILASWKMLQVKNRGRHKD